MTYVCVTMYHVNAHTYARDGNKLEHNSNTIIHGAQR